MKIAIMGAGGVGGYFGGLIARAGMDVIFIARGPHKEAINRDGLTVESGLKGLARPNYMPSRIRLVVQFDDNRNVFSFQITWTSSIRCEERQVSKARK